MTRTVLVGNAPGQSDLADLVDSADTVIRFNKAYGFGGSRGSRTDQLWLINHGGQMAEWLERDALAARAASCRDGVIVLPIPLLPGHRTSEQPAEATPSTSSDTPVDPDRINHLHAARRCLQRAGHRVQTVSVADYRACQRALSDSQPSASNGAAVEAFPSTGFLALWHTLMQSRSAQRIELVGFTFQGWRGHSWEAERRWVSDRILAGRLTLHPH